MLEVLTWATPNGHKVHIALVEHRKAVFDRAEAMRAQRFGELNALGAVENETYLVLFAEMRREMGVPWDDATNRFIRWPKPKNSKS